MRVLLVEKKSLPYIRQAFSTTFQGSLNFYPVAKGKCATNIQNLILILILKGKLNHRLAVHYKSAPIIEFRHNNSSFLIL
jgi:hypothetical protein